MLNVGDTVTIKVRNVMYDVRHRYPVGMFAEFNEYTGTVVHEKWFGADEVGITSDTPGIKIRRIKRERIVEVSGAKFDYQPVKNTREVITIQGSKGNTYIVTKENGKVSCSCPGHQFRRTCKHVQGLV